MTEEKDIRPVRCYICGKKMYYSGHPKHEKEYQLHTERTVGFVHASCIRFLKKNKEFVKSRSEGNK